MSQQPSVGRIVHYQSYGTPGGEYLPEPRAAIITEVQPAWDIQALRDEGIGYTLSASPSGPILEAHDGRDVSDLKRISTTVGLCVLNPTGQFFNQKVPYAEEPTPGHWNWPPRV